METKAPRILIFRGGALGDFLLTLPALAALRRHFPMAYIELAGYDTPASIALAAKLIDRVRSLDSAPMALYFQGAEKLPCSEKEYIRSFDLIVSYLHDPDGVLSAHLRSAGAVKVVAVSPVEIKSHAADHFLSALKDVLGDEKCLPAKLEWPVSLRKEAQRRLSAEIGNKRVIIIHPGSGSSAKNWPAEKFAALAKKIRATKSFEPVIVGGEVDTKSIAVMRSLLPDFRFIVNAPLLDIASILSVASGYVGNDSGVTHLAAVLGIPGIALFGPTDPAVWAPRGKNVRVITSRRMTTESLAEIGVASVFSALKKYLQF